jgi:primosomal protein N'
MPVQVSPSLNIFESLTYSYNGDPALLVPGTRVIIPVGKRVTGGWVTGTHSDYRGRVKNILAVVRDRYLPDNRYMGFINAVSGVYFTSVGTLLDASLPPGRKNIGSLYLEDPGNPEKIERMNKYSLTDLEAFSRSGALYCFYKSRKSSRLPLSPSSPIVKEEIHQLEHEQETIEPVKSKFIIGDRRNVNYREIVDDCLSRGKSVLIAVPDNLTAAYIKKTLDGVDIYNSEIKASERDALWERYARGENAGVVVGALSAVLLPIQNLGAVIIERAGSAAYKRSYFSRYHIHLLARLRARYFNVPLIEGFSTFTVQAYRDRSSVFIDDMRVERVSAEVRTVKGGTRGIPDNFLELVSDYFDKGKKVLIVLNKKESFNFLFCRKCQKVLRCPRCDRFIDVDQQSNIKCSHCGHEESSQTHCYKCGEPVAVVEDISIASVKKTVKTRIAESGIMTLSAEGLKDDHIYSLMKRIEDSKIIISTPVILNPFFNRIFDAVIYIRPESYFNIDQYDAAEKIFSMAAELRELIKPGGQLDIFSIFHFHYSLKLLNDEDGFFDRELKYREWFHLPPFANVYHIEIKAKDLRKLGKEMREIYKKFKTVLNIKRIYLGGRKAVRGAFKGIIEAHTQPDVIRESGILGSRDISIDLLLI